MIVKAPAEPEAQAVSACVGCFFYKAGGEIRGVKWLVGINLYCG